MRFVPMAFFLALFACGKPAQREPSLHDLAASHLESFRRFEGWARRASLGADAFSRPDAFRETAFAPLRDDPSVVGAWILTPRPGARTFTLHEGVVMPTVRWKRHPRASSADLEIARADVAPRASAPLRSCILISRRSDPSHSPEARIVVAFATE